MPWKQLFANPRLQQVIATALEKNQDLRATLANVASARAEYHVERSYQLPTLAASGSGSIQRQIDHGGNASSGTQAGSSTVGGGYQSFSGSVGFSSFELDLFGRLKNQSREQFETYLSSESGYRSARLTLVANVATAYATLASDRDLLKLAQDTATSAQRTVDLNRTLFKSGLAAGSDIATAETVLEQAKSDVASQTTLVAQDRNALDLLVGEHVGDDLLPASLSELDTTIGQVPAGLSSDVLLRRPDVVEAEHSLKATYAQIGAARAAFFPTISLTGALGAASTALSSLFDKGNLIWSASSSVSQTIWGGTNKGNLEYAKAQREYYLSQYRYAVQSAFKDVADALARRGTITDQRQAQDRLVDASNRSYKAYDDQYRAGTGTLIDALSAQRTLYSAQQTRISTVLADLTNRITVYSAIGSDDSLGKLPDLTYEAGDGKTAP
ncbi:efflux transporter outer membrane subunit [Novosphingobium sp. 9]|uniref:efflux transporter outer membrane subunit n=1 Tax=Novosphingobium sp. 9 TaxID=2025349 RepID=UPI0028CB299D|nr:efflux transporter outer membrane subunit [Novosphingobium sp. 9]